MASQLKVKYTPDEYLALDRAAEHKSEYIDGVIVAMTGGTFNHSVIAATIGALLFTQLRGGPCRPTNSDMRVQVSPTRFLFPDVVVVCGPPQLLDERNDVLLNPAVVVEVLSKSTESRDRGRKAAYYRTMPSLSDYLLVAQDRPHIELYSRQPDGSWRLTEAIGLDASLSIPSIGCALRLSDVYESITSPSDSDAAE